MTKRRLLTFTCPMCSSETVNLYLDDVEMDYIDCRCGEDFTWHVKEGLLTTRRAGRLLRAPSDNYIKEATNVEIHTAVEDFLREAGWIQDESNGTEEEE